MEQSMPAIIVARIGNRVSVRCPFCMEGHRHGAGADGTTLGERRAACGRGYYVLKDREPRIRTGAPRKDR